MELRQIEFFLQLYKDQNMTIASQNLYISQQGLSKSISRLEEELDLTLFERSVSGVTPTKAAARLFPSFEKIILDYNALLKNAETLKENYTLRLLAPHGFALACGKEVFLRYGRLFPENPTRYHEEINHLIPQKLKNHEADLAFLLAPVPDNLISHQLISQEPLYAVMDSHNPLADRASISLADLREGNFLLLDVFKPYNDYLLSSLKKSHIPFQIYSTVGMNEFLPILSEDLIGFSFQSIFQFYALPDISFIPLMDFDGTPIIIEIYLVSLKNMPVTSPMQSYINYHKNLCQK